MPIKVVVRKSSGHLTLDGFINGKRYQRRAETDNLKLAREEAATWEAEILRTAWHGERRGARSFAEAALSYLQAQERRPGTKRAVGLLTDGIGTLALGEINQQ